MARATPGPGSSCSDDSRTRKCEAFSCRKIEAETENSLLAVGEAGAHVVRPAGAAHRDQQVLHRRRAAVVEQLGDRPADQPAGRHAEQLGCGRIGFDDLLRRDVDDQHRLGGELEQQAVARLGVAQAGIFALHRLLGVDQPLLQAGDRAQIAADRHHPAVLAQPHRRISHQEVGAARRRDG